MAEFLRGKQDLLLGLAIGGLGIYLALQKVSFVEREKRNSLKAQLRDARQRVSQLEDRLAEVAEEEAEHARENETPANSDEPQREIRIWMDGAFDIMHYGHMNAFRQGRSMGTYLVVGVNSDESITECKGPPVMTEDERLETVKACKFVDEVEPNCPYIMNDEYLEEMIEKHKLDYIVHGDDPCIVDGRDVYETAVAKGIYRTIPRTEGVSTTEIVGRMLLFTRDHHISSPMSPTLNVASKQYQKQEGKQAFTRRSKFLTTNRMLRLFSAGNKDPAKNAVVVYMDGAWDMFHAGHCKILEKAKALGDYLIVGVHNDGVVNAHYGSNYPIMNMQERVLSVLGCSYVDDVLIDAPWTVTREMIASLKINIVAQGTKGSSSEQGDQRDAMVRERHGVAIQLGLFREIDSPSELTVQEIVRRIRRNEERFRKKYERKVKAENEYYDNRYADVPKVEAEDEATP